MTKQIDDIIENFDGVNYHGSLSQKKLYDLMAECKYWYYPTEYEETFCITALEMLGHRVLPIVKESAGLTETLNGFNVKSLDNIDEDISWEDALSYVDNCDWNIKKTYWISYIYNMNDDTQIIENDEIDMLTDLEPVPPQETFQLDDNMSIDAELDVSDSFNLDEDIAPVENFDELEINEEIFNFDCVYIISLEHTEEN